MKKFKKICVIFTLLIFIIGYNGVYAQVIENRVKNLENENNISENEKQNNTENSVEKDVNKNEIIDNNIEKKDDNEVDNKKDENDKLDNDEKLPDEEESKNENLDKKENIDEKKDEVNENKKDNNVNQKSIENSNVSVENAEGNIAKSIQLNSDMSYQVHIQDIGWQNSKQKGETAGTEGQAKRLEAIKIYSNIIDLKYQVHIQDIGWQNWRSKGEIAGTEGQSKRLEAIKIETSSDKYTILYRVHIQDIGWQDWKSSGEIAGTEGQSKRLEAIQIKIVKKKQECKLTASDGINEINEYKKDNIHYLFVTKNYNLSDLKIKFDSNVIKTSYGTINSNQEIVGDFSKQESFKLTLKDGSIEDVVIIKSDVPALYINLKNNVTLQTINGGSKDTKYNATFKIIGDDNEKYNISDDNIEIKGRGNTSWAMKKKSYQIKLNKKQNLFNIGNGKSKKWVLLANYSDPTLLKNKIMYDLCVKAKLSSIPNSKSVDLDVNGDYIGNYLLCDKVEIGSARINLKNKNAVLAELDNAYYKDEQYNFQTKYSLNHYSIKEFGDDDMSNVNKIIAMNSFKESLERFESLLYADNTTWNEISKLIDVNSFAKYYVINEFSKNLDTYFSSTYLYKDGENDVIHMGPVWDYDKDNFQGNTDENYSANLSNYMSKLYKYPQFVQIVNKIYEENVKENLNNINVFSYSKSIQKSSKINSIVWNSESEYNNRISQLSNWIEARKNFFNRTYTNSKMSVFYSAHVEDLGWINTTSNANVIGTVGKSKRMEAIRAYVTDENGEILPIEIQSHIQDIGWQDWKSQELFSGTIGQSKRMEAIRIRLPSQSDKYSILYRVHVQDIGWQDWKKDGEVAGTTGQAKRIEAIQIKIQKK